MHSLTFYFAFVDLLVKLSFFMKLVVQGKNYIMLQHAKLCENECKSTTSFNMTYLLDCC
jgi:hypothetical protein